MALDSIGSLSTTATGLINTILTEEANRIGSDIHAQTLHTSPWIDLIRKSEFPSDMGFQLNTIIYDRSLPIVKGATGLDDGTLGLSWQSMGVAETGSGATPPGPRPGFLGDPSRASVLGPNGGTGGAEARAYVDFTRRLRSYSLSRAVVESPRINIEDLRFAAHRQEQLRAIMDLLKESTRFSWEERYRDEYDRVCDNAINCLATGTFSNGLFTGATGTATASITNIAATYVADSNISNKILDGVYYRLVRQGAGSKAYGRENGRPVFGLVLSSEASYQLLTEAGFRDDIRYNSAKVSDLLAPLGVEKAFRGFYHLVDDLAPRFTDGGTTYTRVPAYSISTADASNGAVIVPNPSYETADFEAAYVLHEEVMEALIPAPISGVQGMTFNPVNYKGDFKWTNIPNESTNPDGTIGFFRGILASASKPIKTNFGYAIVFKRTSATPAA